MQTEYLPNALQWSEGLLLSPQHLQQNDILWHERLHYLAQSLDPTFWGVRKLVLDTGRLVQGQVFISELEAILSDGTVIQFPGNFSNAQPPVQLFADTATVITTGVPLRIWLVLPERGRMAAARNNPQRRFLSFSDNDVYDESAESEKEAVAVDRLLPKVSLYAGVVPPPLNDVCPLLEVTRDADNHYSLTTFHPPMLCIGASDFLGERSLQQRLADLKQTMWEKLRELVRETGADSDNADVSADNATQGQLTIARHLAMSLPLLSIMADNPQSRPINMYAMLAQVAGQVAPIGANPMPPLLDAYNHLQCYEQFDTVIRYISRKLDSVNTRYQTWTFARVGSAGFGRRLPDNHPDNVVIELRPRDGQTLESLTAWLNDCAIHGLSLLQDLQDRRVLGAHRAPMSAAEIAQRGLRNGGLFFLLRNKPLDAGGKLVPAYRAGDTLLIRGLGDNKQAPADIVLHYLRAGSSRDGVIPTVSEEVTDAV